MEKCIEPSTKRCSGNSYGFVLIQTPPTNVSWPGGIIMVYLFN